MREVLLLVAILASAAGAWGEAIEPPASHQKVPKTHPHHAMIASPTIAKSAGPNEPSLTTPVPTLPPSETSQAADFPALAHAKSAGVSTCLDGLMRLLPATIDAPHEAFSFWAKEHPDRHLFGTIAGLRYAQPAAPRGVSIVAVMPNDAHACEGVGIQIIPTARSCGTIQASLLTHGRALTALTGLPLVETSVGQRLLIAPTAGNGCVVIAVSQLDPGSAPGMAAASSPEAASQKAP